jgi:hypothetical protein
MRFNAAFIAPVIFTFCLQSCDPGCSVTVQNESSIVHEVTVVHIDTTISIGGWGQPKHRDSFMVGTARPGLENDHFEGMQKKNWISATTYTFKLPPGRIAETQLRRGTQIVRQLIIIDGYDTIDTWNDHGRLREKEPKWMLGGMYYLTLR